VRHTVRTFPKHTHTLCCQCLERICQRVLEHFCYACRASWDVVQNDSENHWLNQQKTADSNTF
jgi:hypothetical protein